MGSSKKPKQNVDDYYMDLHFGVCSGPVDEVTGIFVGEKLAWSGSVTSSSVINVSKKNLFGGNKREGGVDGSVFVLMGTDDQVVPEPIAERFGLSPLELPGFRGILSLFFTNSAEWDGTFPEVPDPGPGEGEETCGGMEYTLVVMNLPAMQEFVEGCEPHSGASSSWEDCFSVLEGAIAPVGELDISEGQVVLQGVTRQAVVDYMRQWEAMNPVSPTLEAEGVTRWIGGSDSELFGFSTENLHFGGILPHPTEPWNRIRTDNPDEIFAHIEDNQFKFEGTVPPDAVLLAPWFWRDRKTTTRVPPDPDYDTDVSTDIHVLQMNPTIYTGVGLPLSHGPLFALMGYDAPCDVDDGGRYVVYAFSGAQVAYDNTGNCYPFEDGQKCSSKSGDWRTPAELVDPYPVGQFISTSMAWEDVLDVFGAYDAATIIPPGGTGVVTETWNSSVNKVTTLTGAPGLPILTSAGSGGMELVEGAEAIRERLDRPEFLVHDFDPDNFDPMAIAQSVGYVEPASIRAVSEFVGSPDETVRASVYEPGFDDRNSILFNGAILIVFRLAE